MQSTARPSLLRSWWKQEALALAPQQRQRLLRLSAVLLIALAALNLQRHHHRHHRARNASLTQARELAEAQWSALRATAYDWAHWDETHAFARGQAPGYPERNLKAANGLTRLAPVVLILNRHGTLLALEGREGPSSWSRDPLVLCTQRHAKRLISQPQSRGISCRAHGTERLWIGVIEPITDTREQQNASGLMVLLAPLRHPSHGPQLQRLMAALERQLTLAAHGPQAMHLQGQTIWSDSNQVLTLRPQPVVLPALGSLGRIWPVSPRWCSPFCCCAPQ